MIFGRWRTSAPKKKNSNTEKKAVNKICTQPRRRCYITRAQSQVILPCTHTHECIHTKAIVKEQKQKKNIYTQRRRVST